MTLSALRRSVLLAAFIGPLGCTAGGASPGSAASRPETAAKKGGAVIARYGDQTLTADELTAKVDERSPFDRARMNTLEKKKELVEQIARFDLLADEAKRRGLDKDPEVVRAMQTVMVRKLVQQQIDENPENKKISDPDLQAFYDAHKDEYQRPEMVRLSAIVLGATSKAAAAKREGEAEALVKQLRANASDYSEFGAMVAQKSEDPASKGAQGDLRYASQEQLTQRYGAELASAAFAMKQQGAVSDPIVTEKGVFILKLTGRMPALNQTFEQAKPVLSQRAWYEKRGKVFDQFIADLKKKANYTVDEAALENFKVDPTAPTDLGLASGAGGNRIPQTIHASATLPRAGEKASP
jgi:peptidyl-prolyl cis-trans isomerase C